ncbi:MAG: DJ-1/PfpI family protein [Lachnospiraceae bacterium]
MANVGIFLADGFEEIEALTVVDILRRAQIEITMISIMASKEITGAHGIKVMADAEYSEIDFLKLDGIVLPGGMPGTLNLEKHSGVKEQICAFAGENKLVAAICAAPSILGKAGLLQGKTATCYPGIEEKLSGAVLSEKEVCVDGNIMTSKGMGTAIPFSLNLVEYFKGREKADEISNSIIYSKTLTEI